MAQGVATNGPVASVGTKRLLARWGIIALPLFLINLIAQVDKIGISVVMSNKQFLQDLNLVGKPAIAGLLMTGFLISYACFHFFWAYWIKKFGPRNSAILGIVIWAITFLLSGIATTAAYLIAARCFLGIGEAVVYPMANAFVANWFPQKERSRASSVWMTGTQFGGAVCGALIVGIMAFGGWRTVFFALCGLNLLIPLPLMIFLMKDFPRQSKMVSPAELELIESGSLEKTKEVPKAQVKGGYLTNYRFWLVTVCWGFNNIYWWGWSTWMPTYFQTVRHFSFKSAGYIYSLNFFFNFLAILVVGWASDKVMRRAPFGGVGWILAGILLFIGGIVVVNPYYAVVVLVLSGCCHQPAFVMSQALLQSIIKENTMGSAVAVSGGISQFMAFVSPSLVGLLLGLWGFDIVIVCLGISLVIPGVMTLYLAKQGY